MNPRDLRPGLLRRAYSRAAAFPLLIKVLGAVTVVALLFGAVVNLYVRHSLTTNLSRLTEQATKARATAFAARAERLLITGDRMGLQDLVRRERQTKDSLRYVVVFDSNRRVVAHSFRNAPPQGLIATLPKGTIQKTQVRTLRAKDEIIFEALVPVVHGQAGFVQFGVGSQPIVQRVDRMVNRLWLVLGICLIVGLLLVVPLAAAMTAPLRRLIHATDMLREGELSFRAPTAPMDEVGELTSAFNRMAEVQQQQREELEVKKAERLELLASVVTSQEEERRRIAHDLHDELGGSLSALLIDLRTRHEQCETDDGQNEARAAIEEQVNGMIGKVRHLAWTLRPAALDDIGLCAALDQQAVHLQKRTGMKIEFCGHSSGCSDCSCPQDVKLVLYRVAQEAMTNCLRHSGAERVSVIVMSGRSEVSVLVEDDGRGFDPHNISADRPHLGLRGMMERVDGLSGTLTVESSPGSGTVIRATIPIEDSVCPRAKAPIATIAAQLPVAPVIPRIAPAAVALEAFQTENEDDKNQNANRG